MDFTQVAFPGEKAYILPIGDIHWGDKAFANHGRAKLQGNLEWLRQHEGEAKGILMGDVFNVASRESKTSPFETDSREFLDAKRFFEPYAHLFIGAIRGNHERRLYNSHGFDPLELFCDSLDMPYFGVSALVRVRVGKRPEEGADKYWNIYNLAVHHTTGGAGKLGNALSGVLKLGEVIPGCDVYAGGHNHQLVMGVQEKLRPTPTGPQPYKVHYVSCGSYLEYRNSYAEEGLMLPGKLGSPRIRFSGIRDKHDVHISI